VAPSPGTVLVTGGTGFIGGWCIADLVAKGYTVRATVRDLTRSGQVTEAISRTVDRKPAIEFVTADLNADDGWDQAMAGVRAVMHVASPMGIIGGGSAESLVSTTFGGVERVFAAAGAAGVERIVMTSAANASSPSSYASGGVTDETLWTDPDDPTLIPYRRAKTLAEQLAWDLAGKPGSPELVTILPGAVFGPVLSASTVGSVGIIGRMLEGKMRRLPRIGFEIVDVRDLGRLHSLALVEPRAAGERFLGTGDFLWMRDMANVLRCELGVAAERVPTRGVPDFLVRLAARRDPALREVAPTLGRRHRHSTTKARDLLGWNPRPATQTIVDCARSLIDLGIVQTQTAR
jgi:dihydroflavonol-4-reductase